MTRIPVGLSYGAVVGGVVFVGILLGGATYQGITRGEYAVELSLDRVGGLWEVAGDWLMWVVMLVGTAVGARAVGRMTRSSSQRPTPARVELPSEAWLRTQDAEDRRRLDGLRQVDARRLPGGATIQPGDAVASELARIVNASASNVEERTFGLEMIRYGFQLGHDHGARIGPILWGPVQSGPRPGGRGVSCQGSKTIGY